MKREGRKVEGFLTQGEDGLWREVKPSRVPRRKKSEREKELDEVFRAVNRAIFEGKE